MSGGISVAAILPPPVEHIVSSSNCPLFVGTCGYSYGEWKDYGFYPAGTRTTDMLGLYMRFFSVVELNYTWYQMPRADAMARMAARIPEGFALAVKITRTMTHERRHELQDQLRRYRLGIEPLAGKLLAVLVQLPPDFERSRDNRCHLARLLDGLEGLPVAVEFRHHSWAMDTVFAELERRRVTLVAVDAPPLPGLFPPLDIVTNPDFFYVRLHGRNAKEWNSGNMQKKFDYDYTPAELEEWRQGHIRTMSRRAGKGLIFFNNHVRARAPGNARTLLQMLRKSV